MLQRDSDPTCRLCGLEVENPEHLLLDCQELCLLRGMLKIEGRRVIINQRKRGGLQGVCKQICCQLIELRTVGIDEIITDLRRLFLT